MNIRRQSIKPTFYLDALSAEDCETVRGWRNQNLGMLRTPHLLTVEQQQEFYASVVCDRTTPYRYFAVRETGLVGIRAMAGLVDVQWENGLAEISLIVDPDEVRTGIGTAAVDLVLAEAFKSMRLSTVWGECYGNNPALPFWQKMVKVYSGYETTLPRRKFWAGRLWDSYYFSFTSPVAGPM